MKTMTRSILILAIGIVIGAGGGFVQTVVAERQPAAEPLPLEDIQVLAEVFGKIKNEYVEEVGDRELLRHAIKGMLAGLDPHSTYLDADSFKEVRIGTEGQFGGLGLEVTQENGYIKVVAPIDDTPAHQAGLQPGDIITELDGTSVKDMNLNEAVKLMRGKPGTEIRLTIVREGVSQPLDVKLKRSVIKITSIKGRILEDKFAYIRVTQFQSATAENLREKINTLQKQTGGALDGLILDLRNNPGGVLNGAVAVSDTFLREGVIVSTKGRQEDSELKFSATPNDFLEGVPMVVLVNSGSASASEIVAGALQDHKRAVIMGTKTFGKGSVQTILPMKNGSALKITTARYYTPNDRSIQATGIEPDVVVENLKLADGQDAPNDHGRVRESNLSGHLRNENGDNGDAEETAKSKNGTEEDYQLREALNLLKGMNIVRVNTRSDAVTN